MKHLVCILFLVWFLCAGSAALAQTGTASGTSGTITYAVTGDPDGLRCVSYTWTSKATGTAVAWLKTGLLEGYLKKVIFIPGTGAAAPTNTYSVTVKDRDGFDILWGAGATRSTTETQQVVFAAEGTTATALSNSVLRFERPLLGLTADVLWANPSSNTASGTTRFYVDKRP